MNRTGRDVLDLRREFSRFSSLLLYSDCQTAVNGSVRSGLETSLLDLIKPLNEFGVN